MVEVAVVSARISRLRFVVLVFDLFAGDAFLHAGDAAGIGA